MHSALRFDIAYRETVVLPGGERLVIRLLKPSDRARLRKAFDTLSHRTRYLRFHHAKSELSGEELHFFTNMDGWRHFALAACRCSPLGREELVATARFVRSATDETVAEAALTVVDPCQGKGLGEVLLDRLIRAAAERRIERLHFFFLNENVPAYRLLEQCGYYVTFGHLESKIAAELHVPHENRYAGSRYTGSRPRRRNSATVTPILTPASLGLTGFESGTRQTQDVLALVEQWRGLLDGTTGAGDAD